jgi:hypothetical protein
MVRNRTNPSAAPRPACNIVLHQTLRTALRTPNFQAVAGSWRQGMVVRSMPAPLTPGRALHEAAARAPAPSRIERTRQPQLSRPIKSTGRAGEPWQQARERDPAGSQAAPVAATFHVGRARASELDTGMQS